MSEHRFTSGLLSCPTCRRIYYPRDIAEVRRELRPDIETIDEWLRCARCGTAVSQFIEATDDDMPPGGESFVTYECAVEPERLQQLADAAALRWTR
jgi:4-hydroxy-3-methylbut-2-en-1-yl diphosphate synthase IspG/GcpE